MIIYFQFGRNLPYYMYFSDTEVGKSLTSKQSRSRPTVTRWIIPKIKAFIIIMKYVFNKKQDIMRIFLTTFLQNQVKDVFLGYFFTYTIMYTSANKIFG